jgi:hypothetical protein
LTDLEAASWRECLLLTGAVLRVGRAFSRRLFPFLINGNQSRPDFVYSLKDINSPSYRVMVVGVLKEILSAPDPFI